MKCKCGNDIQIQMAAKVKSHGCNILTSMTTIITAECNKCKARFQVPVNSNNYIMTKKKD